MMTLEQAERLADLIVKKQALREELKFQTPGSRWFNIVSKADSEIHIAIDNLIEEMNNG